MDYLIKSSALIIVFYLCYKFLLQRDTFFQTNRWFLIFGLIISFCLPLIVIPIYVTKEISAQFINLNANAIIESTHTETAFNLLNVFTYIYVIGIFVLSIRLLSQLISLAFTLSKGSSKKIDGYIYIETDQAIAPFSFFNYIVFNPIDFNTKELEHIINHEKVHADQNHSIDILISHLASIICWFNPFVWLYKKNLQQNLEFIADNQALLNSNCKKTYQYVLLKTSMPNYQMALTNNFYNSLIKKRIVMLHKNKSKKRNQIKMVLILPVLAIFLMSFSTKEIITYTTIKDHSIEESVKIPTKETLPIKKEETHHTPSTKKNASHNPAVITPEKSTTKENAKGDLEVIVITKDISNKELNAITSRLEKEGITLKFKGIKRNSQNEITAIKIQAKSKNSNASISESQDDPIGPITIKIENGSISISNGHDSGHRDYIFESHDGKTKIHTSKGNNVFIHSDGGSHEEHEVIEEDDKIIIKSDGKIKEIKKVGKSKSIWVTSDHDNDEHETIDILEDEDGKKVIIKKGKDGKIIKSSSKNTWVFDSEDTGEDSILELKKGDNALFISSDNHGKQPLIIVNGKEKKKGGLKDIDPNTIESINVLKGEAAIKKYGDKGKDGVLEITTKN